MTLNINIKENLIELVDSTEKLDKLIAELVLNIRTQLINLLGEKLTRKVITELYW
jgi:hypothetical protein